MTNETTKKPLKNTANSGLIQLINHQGHRLYLNHNERLAFLEAAAEAGPRQQAYAELLYWTGARLSEGLSITPLNIDFDDQKIIFRTLKRKRDDIYRAVPVPPEFIDNLNRTFGLRRLRAVKKTQNKRIFPWTDRHAWKIIKDIMTIAEISEGPHRSPKGLRHSFAIHALRCNVPVTAVQKWLGHANIATTTIYVDFVEGEANEVASRMWGKGIGFK